MTLQEIFTYAGQNKISVNDALLMQMLSDPATVGIGVGGVNTKAYKAIITNNTLILANVLSFSVIATGTAAGYFTNDAADGVPNRQTIAVNDNLSFGGAINFFSYLKLSAPLNSTLTITYILKA